MAARRISDHELYAADWGVTLSVSGVLPESFNGIGFRAHDFIPVYGQREENCIPCRLIRETDLPFEKNYYIAPDHVQGSEEESSGSAGTEDCLLWRVQRDGQALIREKGMPDYLRFPEEALLFLNS